MVGILVVVLEEVAPARVEALAQCRRRRLECGWRLEAHTGRARETWMS